MKGFMSISDFVCYVLKVPANLDGYVYICKAIKYVVEHNGDSGFYEHLQSECGKSYACIEKGLRLAKTKALKRMSDEDFIRIFLKSEREIKAKEFICYAAQYYRKEFGNENERA